MIRLQTPRKRAGFIQSVFVLVGAKSLLIRLRGASPAQVDTHCTSKIRATSKLTTRPSPEDAVTEVETDQKAEADSPQYGRDKAVVCATETQVHK